MLIGHDEKQTLSFLLLIIAGKPCFSQQETGSAGKNANVEWGHAEGVKGEWNGIISYDGDRYYALKTVKKKYFVEQYSREFNLLDSKELIFPAGYEYEYAVGLNKKRYIFFRNDDKETQTLKLFYRQMDENNPG